MKKQILAILGAGALIAVVAVPALARGGHHHGNNTPTPTPPPVLNANVNVALVDNESTATASTGENLQGNTLYVEKAGAKDVEVEGDNYMKTGDADARAAAIVVANTTVGCSTCTSSTAQYNVNADLAGVRNRANAEAYTDLNRQGNYGDVLMSHAHDVEVEGDNDLRTGNASARDGAIVVVNTHWNGLVR